jgi:transposase
MFTMTTRSSRRDAKAEALRAHGALHPRPQAVQAPLFASHDFFDPRDLVQVKYEMLRQVDVEGAPVARTADAFGVSRPTFYQTQTAFKQRGLAGLVPRKRGPHGAHKLDDAVMAFVATLRTDDPALSVRALLPRIHERFGLDVHPRSLERALRRAAKKRR